MSERQISSDNANLSYKRAVLQFRWRGHVTCIRWHCECRLGFIFDLHLVPANFYYFDTISWWNEFGQLMQAAVVQLARLLVFYRLLFASLDINILQNYTSADLCLKKKEMRVWIITFYKELEYKHRLHVDLSFRQL